MSICRTVCFELSNLGFYEITTLFAIVEPRYTETIATAVSIKDKDPLILFTTNALKYNPKKCESRCIIDYGTRCTHLSVHMGKAYSAICDAIDKTTESSHRVCYF